MKLSDILHNLLEDYADSPLPLAALLTQAGGRGFGIISGFLTLPMLLPWPIPLAGFSTVLGTGIMLVGIQLALNLPTPYLPGFITRLQVSPTASRQLLTGLNRVLRPIEKLSKVRLVQISGNPLTCRAVGLCLVWNGAMGLPLPIPLTNLLPAYTILILSIGILEADGVMILVGYGLTGITTLFFASIAHLMVTLVRNLLQRGS